MTQGILPLTGPIEGESRPAKKKHSIQLDQFQEVANPTQKLLADGLMLSCQIKLSHLYDKLGCLSNSRTRLLPHQIEATHLVVNALRPRFLLADEVGLGKTIEAGLIIKELMLRKAMNRVLIIVPAPLSIQWQQEMRSKFNEDFAILNRKNFYQFAQKWSAHKRIITSIDFIKNPQYSDQIINANWDIVIFDEAHRLRRDYSKVTKAWSFAQKISTQCDALLLLSATPFRGKLEELFYLISLLDPHLLGPYHSFIQEYVLSDSNQDTSNPKLAQLKEKISKVMLRRRKVDVGGFTKRHATTIRFDLSTEERQLYDETTEYVKREYNLATRDKNRAVSFIMIVFQKLLDSSTRALLRSLERRKTILENKMYAQVEQKSTRDDFYDNIDAESFLDDCDSPDDFFESLDSRNNSSIKEMRKEIMTLNFLIRLARNVKTDRKAMMLISTINKLEKQGCKKFIIFTQFRTTQDYLAEILATRHDVDVFHGSLSLREKEEAIENFRTSSDILILTEAGGEGRNLQFTNILINYDLPWSPLKIEQRIGRVHRFGQEKDVYIFNFATVDTVAERILEILETKIHLFTKTIGTPDVLLGNLEHENKFQKNFMKFISGQKTRKELHDELEARTRIARTGYKKLNDLVTVHCMDFNLNDYYEYSKTNRKIDNDRLEKITNEYLELFQNSGFHLIANKQSPGTPRFSKDNESPYTLCDTNKSTKLPATFNSGQALANPAWEFLALGHPLIEEALVYFLKHSTRQWIVCVDDFKQLEQGYVFAFLCEFRNGMNRSEIIYCHIDLSGKTTIYENESRHKGKWVLPNPANPKDKNDNLEMNLKTCIKDMEKYTKSRALEIRDSLHTIFKSEEYKLEISYGKKLRSLEEKHDRMKFRYQQDPIVSNQALLTRTKNEINKTNVELEAGLYSIRQGIEITPNLTLLQIIESQGIY